MADAETEGDRLSHISFEPEEPPVAATAVIATGEARAAAIGEAAH